MIASKPITPNNVGIFLGVERLTGGMFQYALAVLEALSKLSPHQYSVVIAYSDQAWAPILERLGLSGYRMKHSRIGQRIGDIGMALRLPISINQILGKIFNPLIWELHALRCDAWFFPAGETLTYQMSGRMIGVIHDLMHRYEPSFPEVSKLFRYGLREHRMGNIARYCKAVLVDSNIGRQHVIDSYGVSEKKVYVVPYIAPSYLHSTSERIDFDGRYKLPSKYIFYPAQFWPHKNHLRLIEALKMASQDGCDDVQLVLSGAKRYRYEEVKACVDRLGLTEKVHFVGYIPDNDLRGFYLRARAMIMPTFFGPTNIPPLEAIATGCPVIVSGIYGMPEQLGDAALYFDPKSISEIAERIKKVWSDDDLVKKMSRKGLEQSLAYGQAEFNSKIEHVIESLFIG